MARRRTVLRALLALAGVLLGFVLVLLAGWLWLQEQRRQEFEVRASAELGLPAGAFEVERVERDGRLRIALRDVVLLDSTGGRVLEAPLVRARFDAGSLNREGMLEFDQVEIERPAFELRQDAQGAWTVLQVMAVTAAGDTVTAPGDGARPIAFRGVRIRGGTARVLTPYTPPDGPPPGRFASVAPPRRVRTPDGPTAEAQVHLLTGLDATLPLIRVGGNQGWRVEIADVDALVRNPDTRITALAGWFEDRGDDVVRFAVTDLRTTHSRLEADGSMGLGGETVAFDVDLRARALDFRDLRGMGLPLPEEGEARFDLAVESVDAARLRWTVTGADVHVLDSRARGRLTAVTGGEEIVFGDTRLELDPLRLEDLAALGYVDSLQVGGVVRGTVSADGATASSGGLRVDVAASLVPAGEPGAVASTVTAVGGVGFGGGGVRLDGLRVETPGLQLAVFRSFVDPESADLLRGALRGGATLSGPLSDLRLEGGELTFQVGDAPASTLSGITGRVSTEPTLSYDLRAEAAPLELATLTALFPALPFRPSALRGPVAVSGAGDEVRFSVDLDGAAGAFAARGTATLGEVMRFDVTGEVEAFRAPAVFAMDQPVAEPVSGTFAARGTTEDLAFQVDLTQGDTASLALRGGVRRPGGSPAQVDVTGNARNFRVGALFGRPDLLPGPVSGPIAVSGGGRQPYRFEVDLSGPEGRFALNGTFAPGDVPVYAFQGTVRGLDLSGLPGLTAFPHTRLNGTLALDGRGFTPETFQGTVAFHALPGSTVNRQPLTAGTLRASAQGGVLRVDTLAFAVQGGARVEAGGSLGLTVPVQEGIRFSLAVPDLSILGPLLPPEGPLEPDAAGSLSASGVVNGTVRSPALAVTGTGRGLRYDAYRAATLALDVRGTRVDSAWTATGTVEGTGLQLGAGQRLESLRLEANVTPTLASFGVAARRDATTDLTASGEVELADGGVTGAILQSARLRLDGRRWALTERARLAWSGENGLQVENLQLREEDGTGYLLADGVLPPAGAADLTVQASGISVQQLRPLAPTLIPDARGVFGGLVTIEGPVSDPRLRVEARVDSLVYSGVTADSARVFALYQGGRMNAAAAVTTQGRQVITAEAGIPMRLDLGGIVPSLTLVETDSLRAVFRADTLPLALVASLVPQLDAGRGVLDARVEVSGTPEDPVVRGAAVVDSGGFRIVPLETTWHSVQARVSFDGELITVDTLTARTESDGVAVVRGSIRLVDPRAPEVYLTLWTDNFQLVDSEKLARVEADANLALSGRLPDAVLSGTVRVDDATIYIPRFGEERELDIVGADVGQIGADTLATLPMGAGAMFGRVAVREFEVVIGEDVWLESPDARIQIGGTVGVNRPTGGMPSITGDLEARRGTFNLSFLNGLVQREFEIVEGRVQFFGTPDFNPALDITAKHEVRAREPGEQPVIVDVRVAGTLQNPRVELSSASSRVPIPESELVSLLIFGRRSTELANVATDLVQAQVLSEVIAGYFLGGLEQAVVRTGWVDYVRVRAVPTGGGSFGGLLGSDAGPLAALSVELGKQIFNDVFLAVEVAGLTTQAPQVGASLDWEVTRTWSLRAAVEPVRRDPLLNNLANLRRQITVELRRRWEYGRPKTRDPLDPEQPTETPRPGQTSQPTAEPVPAPPPEE